MSAFTHIKKMMYCYKDKKNVTFIIIGDGIAPKTGILFALNDDEWKVYVIDPLISNEWTNGIYSKYFPNMQCYPNKIEEVIFSINNDLKNQDVVVVVGVHSHANLSMVWEYLIKNNTELPLALLSIPCCGGVEHFIKSRDPFLDKVDEGIPSEKNRVMIWKNNCK